MKAIIFIMFVFVAANAAHSSEHRRLTLEQADALAIVAATTQGETRPSSVSFDEKTNSKKFISFEIFYPDSNGSSLYTVNLDTGDVFISPGLEGNCALFPNERMQEVKTKKLKMVQEQVRRTIHLTWLTYQKLRRQKPRCRDR